MADQISNYQCSCCMGPLQFVGASGKLECEYCGSSFTVEEIEASMSEINESAEAAKESADAKEAAARASEDWEFTKDNWTDEGMKAYNCPSCGAELISDENMGASSCPYCGNPTIVPGTFAGMLKPDYVIPFKLDQEAAKNGLKNHYKGKPLLPNSFCDNNHIEEIKGVYVPYWLYDGSASGGASYTCTKVHKKRTQTEEITTTEYYAASRSGNAPFIKVPADGSSKMPDDLMDSIEPYDYKDMTSFSKAYLAGYLADKYDVTAQDNQPKIEKRVKNTLQAMLRETVTGYDTVNVNQQMTHVEQGKISYAMMPVYMLSTKWNDGNYIFAMNGQTGKMVGDLPIDMGKYWRNVIITIIIALAVSMGIIFAIGNIASIMTVVLFVFSILLGFIVGGAQMASMKSVRPATQARDYMPKDKFKLTIKSDKFIRKQVTKRQIQRNN